MIGREHRMRTHGIILSMRGSSAARQATRILLAVALASNAAVLHAQPGRGTGAGGGGIAAAPPAATTYTLAQLIAMARESSPMLAAGRADEAVARAGTITARAWPNPELSVEPGRMRARVADTLSGGSTVLSIAQPIENPWMRDARLRTAQSGVEVARARADLLLANLHAAIRTRFFEIVRLDEELIAYREDLLLTEQIRDRIQARVHIGEAPKFDLYRAEGEVEAARKNLVTARARRLQSMAELGALVGPALAREFDVRTDAGGARRFTQADYLSLREDVAERNADVGLARRHLEQAERQLELERNSVLPQVTLRAASERDPDANITRIGAQVSLPLLNRREGPIAEARAQAERARLVLEQRRFEARASFDAAWQGHNAAELKIRAIEDGILDRARTVLEIAEAAYRLGERGIIEYLDAQRQFRLARNELIAARFELQSARSELERLLGNP